MAKKNKPFTKNMKVEPFFVVSVILIVLLIGFSFYYYFVFGGENNYRIENEYYGFKLKTTKNWFGEENTFYSKEKITQILNECKKDELGLSSYKIGAFRFKNQKSFQESTNNENILNNTKSTAIFEITINCLPNNAKDKITDYSFSNLKVAGENAFSGVLSLSGFSDAKYFSLFHDNFEYKINEYVYISPDDKGFGEEYIIKQYKEEFDKIVSSFKFLK
jgi:hypothetical protein